MSSTVAETPRFRSVLSPSTGVIVKFARSLKSASEEIVQEPSPLSVPSDNVAPAGTPSIVMDVSSANGLAISTKTLSGIAASSLPAAGEIETSGGKPISATSTEPLSNCRVSTSVRKSSPPVPTLSVTVSEPFGNWFSVKSSKFPPNTAVSRP